MGQWGRAGHIRWKLGTSAHGKPAFGCRTAACRDSGPAACHFTLKVQNISKQQVWKHSVHACGKQPSGHCHACAHAHLLADHGLQLSEAVWKWSLLEWARLQGGRKGGGGGRGSRGHHGKHVAGGEGSRSASLLHGLGFMLPPYNLWCTPCIPQRPAPQKQAGETTTHGRPREDARSLTGLPARCVLSAEKLMPLA